MGLQIIGRPSMRSAVLQVASGLESQAAFTATADTAAEQPWLMGG
jgi:hypothetical protein